jgi:hypothetical protein
MIALLNGLAKVPGLTSLSIYAWPSLAQLILTFQFSIFVPLVWLNIKHKTLCPNLANAEIILFF